MRLQEAPGGEARRIPAWPGGEADRRSDQVSPEGYERGSWYGVAAAADHPDADVCGDELSPERLTLDLWPAAS